MKLSNDYKGKTAPIITGLLLLSVLFSFIVGGCGGGSGGGNNNEDPPHNSSGVTVVDSDTAALEIGEVSINDNQEVSLTTTSDSSLGNNLEVGSVVTVVPGVDGRFPFGISGKVSSVTTNSDDTVTATLGNATLADVIDSTEQEASIALNADNFIGSISPSATQATQAAVAAYRSLSAASYSETKYEIDGGVIVRNSPKSLALSREVTSSNVTDLGEVELNLTIPLADMGIEVSGIDAHAAFVITGSLENLMLDHAVDFSHTSGLNALRAIVSGDINVEVGLSASGSVTLGYYSDAWDEVEDAQAELLGVSGKLTGLDGKDKIGKFPIVGLVWSTLCSSTCPTTFGNTQTAVNQTDIGGVIVWLYLDAKGTITLEGEFGSRVNSAEFSVGVDKPEDGDLGVIHSLTNNGVERLLELPYVDGTVGFNARVGVALDVDVFALGVRLANASAELAGNFVTDIEGELSYGTYEIDEDWSWEGSACIYTNYGAGLILSASVNAGVEVSTWLFDVDEGFSYYGQWPSEDEISSPGWHGLGDLTWYTANPENECFNSDDTNSDDDGIYEDFENGDLSQWSIDNIGLSQSTISWNLTSDSSQVWEATGGDLAGNGNSYAHIETYYETDVSVSAKVKPIDIFNPGHWSGILARYTDSTHFYALIITGTGGSAHFFKTDGTQAGETVAIAQLPENRQGIWTELEMKIVGSNIKAYIDDVLYFDITDDTHSSGTVGLANAACKTIFDNFMVTIP